MKIMTWQIRRDKNIKMKDVVEISGLSETTIKNIDRGKTSPTMEQMERLAKAFDVRIYDLFESERK